MVAGVYVIELVESIVRQETYEMQRQKAQICLDFGRKHRFPAKGDSFSVHYGVLEIMKRHERLYRDHESLQKIHPLSEALISCSSHASLSDLHFLTCISNEVSPRIARPTELE